MSRLSLILKASSALVIPVIIYGSYVLSSISSKQEDTLNLRKEINVGGEGDEVQLVQHHSQEDQDSVEEVTEQPSDVSVDPSDNMFANVKSGTIGDRFRSYLISSKSDPIWARKMDLWVLFYNSESYRLRLTDKFLPKLPLGTELSILQERCMEAYANKGWFVHITWSNEHTKTGYGQTVRSLCGNGKEFPGEGNPY